MLLQLPIFFALFRVLRDAYKHVPTDSALYKALCGGHAKCTADNVNHLKFLGIDLQKSAVDAHNGFMSAAPYFILVALVVLTGYLQSRQAQKRTPAANKQMAMVTKVLPVFFGLISLQFPAGLVLYFFVSNLWRLGQQEVIFRRFQAGAATPPKPAIGKGGKAAATAAVIDVESRDRNGDRRRPDERRGRRRRRSVDRRWRRRRPSDAAGPPRQDADRAGGGRRRRRERRRNRRPPKRRRGGGLRGLFAPATPSRGQRRIDAVAGTSEAGEAGAEQERAERRGLEPRAARVADRGRRVGGPATRSASASASAPDDEGLLEPWSGWRPQGGRSRPRSTRPSTSWVSTRTKSSTRYSPSRARAVRPPGRQRGAAAGAGQADLAREAR